MQNIKNILVICLLILLYSVEHADVAAAEQGHVSKGGSPGLTWQFAYDDAGRITKAVDPAGRQTKLYYELDDNKRVRQVVKELPDGSKVTYKFDRFGRRVNMTDAHGTVRYKYDGFGRLIKVSRDGQLAISYTYDTMDRLSSMSLGEGLTIRYEYDFLGRVAKIGTPAGGISYEYQTGQGIVIRTLPNGIGTIWKYGPDGSLQTITHVAKDNKILAQFTYSYRPDGLISTIKEWGPQGERILVYKYDKVQRLTAVKDSRGGEIKYGYDKLGNRTKLLLVNGQSVPSEYDWAGRMTTYDGNDCSHDAAGNLSTYAGREGKRTFEYNSENLLKSASMGNDKVQYSYDGDGYLITRTIGGRKTSFIPDPLTDIWRPLLATNANGKQTFYVWEGYFPLVAISGRETRFFLHDRLGSVRCVADQKGNIVQRYEYKPFGVPQQKSTEGDLRPGFAGLFFDPEASLYLTCVRGYDPRLGRFLQRDPQQRIPFGSQKDLSSYAYCGGDPANFVDYDGLEPRPLNSLNPVRAKIDRISGANWKQLGTEWYEFRDEYTYWDNVKFRAALDPNPIWGFAKFFAADLLQAYMRPLYTAQVAGETWGTADASLSEKAGATVALITDSALFAGNFAGGTVIAKGAGSAVGRGIYYAARDVPGRVLRAYAAKVLVTETTDRVVLPALSKALLPKLDNLQPQYETSGDGGGPSGPGGGLGPGGPGEGADLGGSLSPMTPSNIGGIYLRGAGEAFKQFGPLKGIAIDEKNGKLILLSEGKSRIELPPLRLDDVVTIFRSVYEHGDAPYVSIDPNPEDPEGPIMFVRHGKGTADTYVGWVLFEADRIMKAYSLGCDNVTREPVKSEIDGYQNLFDMGLSNFGGEQKKPIWERFWIVPAKVDRLQTANKQLTLFDIPLRVKTQRMELRDGKLMPAEDDTPSEQAREFAEWFTKCYDKISREVFSRPPEESRIDSPVAIYAELRRIALVTAIAETLRDQGVPLPAWMRHYLVKPCPVTVTTPAIVVEASKTETSHVIEGDVIRTLERTHIQRIYGGVNLAPADEDVHVITAAPEAEKVASDLSKKIATVPVLSPVSFMKNGKQYQAVALPGDNTRDVAPCRLVETDLVVPMQRRAQISVVRKFNSFFQPNEVFGSGWTFDLPHLEEQRQPVRRTGDRTEYRIVYQLTSPLATCSEIFRDHKFVKEVNGELLIPSRSEEILGMGSTKHDKIGHPTKVLIFRDGRRWHFDDAGNFVAQIEGPLTTVYRRDNAHRIQRIEGWHGKKLRADIRLAYDKKGRLISTQGSNDDVAKYSYDEAGLLTRVEGPKGVVGYQYKDGLVRTITQNGQMISREFEYNERGQLLREKRTDGSEIVYTLSSDPGGVKISAVRAEKPTIVETAQYDTAFRPISRVFEDGTEIEWKYHNNGTIESTITIPQGEQYVANYSANDRKTIWQLPEGGTYSVEYDEGGRLITLRQDNHMSLHQQWHSDGRLSKVTYEAVVLHPEYREDGIQTAVFVTAPEKGPKFSRWLRIKYDELGRPETITDYSGSDVAVGYDQTGQVAAIISKRGSIKITHDQEGRVEKVQASWGYNQYNVYDPKTNELKKVEFAQDKLKALVEFDQGRLVRVQNYGGEEFNLSYYGRGDHKGQVRQIRTPDDLDLTYEYDSDSRLASIDCGRTYKLEYTYDNQGRLLELAQVPAKK